MIFYFLTIFAILFSEKATKVVSMRFFSSYVGEIEKEEAKISELEELSILALAMGEKEAYNGFQEMMREIYGKIFFKKIAFFTPLFFLILSPYMIFVDLLGVGSSSAVLAIAILYFSFKLMLNFAKQNYELWKAQKELKEVK
ncbi:MAG: hypothetical protein QXV35_02615, partial [Archaeoglobaceae archaeon]